MALSESVAASVVSPLATSSKSILSRFVEGQDPRNVELIWDQMWRATMPYGRKGLTVQAISAVDLAIWDCLGKLRDEPVYALIGGKTKERLPVYATTSRPDIAQQWGFQRRKDSLSLWTSGWQGRIEKEH